MAVHDDAKGGAHAQGLPPGRGGGVPAIRSTVLTAFRVTAARLFGPSGMEEIARRLPPECLEQTLRAPVRADWLPEQYVVDWVWAIWEGPACQDPKLLDRFIEQEIRQGFGTFRALALSVAVGPESLLGRADRFWREFHTHGELVVLHDPARAREATVTLRDHPYCEAPLTRRMFAESLRNVVALTRARNARATHTYGEATVRVRLSWDS